MKARMILAVAAFAGCGMAMAQESRFSAGLELGMPMGDFGDAYGIGFGATLGYEIPVGDNLGFMAQAGYITFSGKDLETSVTVGGTTVTSSVKVDNAGMIPVQVGLKYYFSDNQEGLYAGLLTGLHMQSVKEVEVTTSGIDEKNTLKSNFGVAPLIGFMVTENIDLALRYQMIFSKQETAVVTGTTVTTEEETVTNSYIGLRAAYMFGSR
ncbi:MAG: outer membrane beta-barrel protein [Flavobacteriales bacterium]